jgi:hypothetical protein
MNTDPGYIRIDPRRFQHQFVSDRMDLLGFLTKICEALMYSIYSPVRCSTLL